ncbi:MAG: NUDIX hydrolase [bacterium]|nr:NUDIX hydrolase [bacterium]
MFNKIKTPYLTIDIIIELEKNKIVLIKRKNPPYGWAIPGGFVDYGESLETAAIREAKEETSLDVELVKQLHTYSDPKRDKRAHIVSVVFIAKGYGVPKACSDAKEIGIFEINKFPEELAFDHKKILEDYLRFRYQIE